MSASLTGAGWFFSASHRDPVRAELHGHTYEVMAWWPADMRADAVELQADVRAVLADFDHKTLPDDFSRAEDLARAIGAQLAGCVRVDIARPSERLAVEVWL